MLIIKLNKTILRNKNILYFSIWFLIESIHYVRKNWILDNPKPKSESDKLLDLNTPVDPRVFSGYGPQVDPIELLMDPKWIL